MLSVIVPIYNIEQYLPRCIESIINQTYKELEILLVDDGSVDSCPQICDRYAQIDSRIKVFHKKNEGLVQARKTGLSRASGKYIAFVDGDDWIESDMYLELVRVMESSHADFLDSSYYCDRGDDFKVEKKNQGFYELVPYIKHRILKTLINLDDYLKITPSIWSKIFKADVIKEAYAKVPDNMQHGEDVISLIYCILSVETMIQVEEAFYHYIYREDSMSHFKSASYLRKELALCNYCGDILLKSDEQIKQEDIDRFLFRRVFLAFEFLLTQKFDVIQYYAIPCIEMLFDKKIVVYGAGRVGKDYLTQISKYERCEIVCWIDRNYKNLHLCYREVMGIEQLLDKQYDIVLLAAAQKQVADSMRQILLEQGVPESKILWLEPNAFF